MKKFFSACLAFILIICAVFPVFRENRPEIVSESACVIDASTGQVLFDKNMNGVYYPASITKVLCALVAYENRSLDTVCTVTAEDLVGINSSVSNIALSPGEEITLRDLMYGLAIESANDAANVIARTVGGSVEGFRQMMNRKAKELGANSSNFVNANGLDDPNHYTTAYDMALITARARQYPELCEIFNTETWTVRATNKQTERTFNSANWFVNGAFKYDGVIFTKIGWTTEALHTMVTVCERDGVRLVCVVMKSTSKRDKWNDTEKLFDWAFSNFYKYTITARQIAAAAPQEISSDNSAYSINKDSLTCSDVTVMLTAGDDGSGLTVEFGTAVTDVSRGERWVPVYIKSGDTVLATAKAVGSIGENKSNRLENPEKETDKISDLAAASIFGVLTFTACLILDILKNKRI